MRKQGLHKRTSTLDWEELRTVLAVVRSGSLSGAARQLRLEHSTVYRRLQSLERRLAVRLFERTRAGYVVNAQGEAIADAARSMEEMALAAERHVFGADAQLAGTVRIATSELFANHLLPHIVAGFMRLHPAIRVEIDVSNRPVDLTRREADLALRGCESPPEHLIGHQLATVRYAIYGSRHLRRGARPLESLPWLGFDDALAQIPQARWWRKAFPAVVPRVLFNSLTAMQEGAARGLGVAVLPCFAASTDKRLIPISDMLPDTAAGIWLLRHPDVRGNARVRAFVEHITSQLPSYVDSLLAN